MGGARISSSKNKIGYSFSYERAEGESPRMVSVCLCRWSPFQPTVGGKQIRSVLIAILTPWRRKQSTRVKDAKLFLAACGVLFAAHRRRLESGKVAIKGVLSICSKDAD